METDRNILVISQLQGKEKQSLELLRVLIREKKMDITIEKNNINGSLILSTIINNRLITSVYYYYTKKQAKKLFIQELKEL